MFSLTVFPRRVRAVGWEERGCSCNPAAAPSAHRRQALCELPLPRQAAPRGGHLSQSPLSPPSPVFVPSGLLFQAPMSFPHLHAELSSCFQKEETPHPSLSLSFSLADSAPRQSVSPAQTVPTQSRGRSLLQRG